MGLVFDIVSWFLLIGGSFFAVVGGIGVYRLPNFYARLHGAGITDTMGAGMLIAGLLVQSIKVGVVGDPSLTPWLITVKLVMILAFLLITSPTACHALAQAAMTDKNEAVNSDAEESSS